MGSGSRNKPKAKRSLAQKHQTASAQAHSHHKSLQPARRKQTKLTLQRELHATQQILSSTTHETQKQLSVTSEKLSAAQKLIATARRNYSASFKEKFDIYQLLRMERRRNERYAATKFALQTKVKEQSLYLARTEQELAAATQERDRAIEVNRLFRLRMTTILSQSDSELARVKQLLSDSRRKNSRGGGKEFTISSFTYQGTRESEEGGVRVPYALCMPSRTNAAVMDLT
ncbi:hypothetical protein DFH09DRAFT_1083267 [Mycena vulgaris]|nr:hypothetical protein DFH09DRAFT_1083267 [Mycena vulgaris]